MVQMQSSLPEKSWRMQLKAASHIELKQEAEADECWLNLLLFMQSGTSAHVMVLPTFSVGLSTSINLI